MPRRNKPCLSLLTPKSLSAFEERVQALYAQHSDKQKPGTLPPAFLDEEPDQRLKEARDTIELIRGRPAPSPSLTEDLDSRTIPPEEIRRLPQTAMKGLSRRWNSLEGRDRLVAALKAGEGRPGPLPPNPFTMEIERRKIEIPEEVKTLGTYTANINLHKEVKATVTFEVVEDQ